MRTLVMLMALGLGCRPKPLPEQEIPPGPGPTWMPTRMWVLRMTIHPTTTRTSTTPGVVMATATVTATRMGASPATRRRHKIRLMTASRRSSVQRRYSAAVEYQARDGPLR